MSVGTITRPTHDQKQKKSLWCQCDQAALVTHGKERPSAAAHDEALLVGSVIMIKCWLSSIEGEDQAPVF